MASRQTPERSIRSDASATAAGAAASSLLYLYGILEAESRGHELLARRDVPGMDYRQAVFPIQYGGLLAAVSQVPADAFEEASLNALLTDLSRLSPYAVRHEQIIRSLLASAPALIPMAFGVVYRGEEGVIQLLRERETEFWALLQRVRGKREWGLKVSRDLERLVPAVEESSDELRRLTAEAAAATAGRAYLLSKQRERLLAAEVQKLGAAWLTEILESLGSITSETVVDPVPPVNEATQAVVLKAAFLLTEAQTAPFQARVRDLDERYSPLGLSLEMNGPWAAYSFVRTM